MTGNIKSRKKKVLIQTDFVLAKTGFGKHAKILIEHLYKTGKYDIVHFSVGSIDHNPELDRTPWKSVGCVNPTKLEQIKRQNNPQNWEGIDRMAGYGAFALDEIVKQEKPDVFIGIQDIWGIDFSVDKDWFKKTTSVLWTTLDSLPILPKAVEVAPKTKHFWSWADFATKALHKMGHNHVKTVRGLVDVKNFQRLPQHIRQALRKKFNISDDTFVIGFVFRNQLRKSVPNLLEGYKLFKKDNPTVKTKLLLHTSWQEGWNIHKLAEEYGINKNEIITTYICKNCLNYQVKPYTGNDLECPVCRAKAQTTTHPVIGITEQELNEVYNLMDVYAHPFTSGGQEIPIQEAKLAELITLVTNYSCGEDSCQDDAGSLPLEYSEYREFGTEFIKASTYPTSIAKQLNKVLKMSDQERRKLGQKGRQWVLNNFSIDVIGKQVEELLDAAPYVDYEEKAEKPKDPYAQVPAIESDVEWLTALYKNILKREDIHDKDEGLVYWLAELQKGVSRNDIENYFRQVAFTENNKTKQLSFEDFLNKEDKGRVLFVMPESAGDIYLCTALFKSIKERYPDWTFYVATKPEYKDILNGNPYVDRWLEYNQMMENLFWLEGNSGHNGYFDVAYLPFVQTQRFNAYQHNGVDKIHFEIYESPRPATNQS